MADEESQRIKQLEVVRDKAKAEAAQWAERQQQVTTEIESLQAQAETFEVDSKSITLSDTTPAQVG